MGDKNFDETDRAKLALGAFSFFMHVLDRYLLEMGSLVVRDRVFDFIIGELVQKIYAKSFTDPPAHAEKLVLNHYDCRASQYSELPSIFGQSSEDANTVLWRAGQTICQDDLDRDDYRLLVIVRTGLMLALAGLALDAHVSAMAKVLCPRESLHKTA